MMRYVHGLVLDGTWHDKNDDIDDAIAEISDTFVRVMNINRGVPQLLFSLDDLDAMREMLLKSFAPEDS